MTKFQRPLLCAVGLGLLLSLPLAQASHGSENELMLFVYPPIKKTNWAGPRRALLSTIGSDLLHRVKWDSINKSVVGHVIIRYRCRDTLGELHDVWTGISGQNDVKEDVDDIFKKKIGLSVLFKDYRDGEIQSEKGESRNRIANYFGRNVVLGERARPRFLRFFISPQQCDEVHDYHETFESMDWDRDTPLKSWRNRRDDQLIFFGFNFKNPHEAYRRRKAGEKVKLGAGCTEFGTSFLKLVGKFDPAFDNFWKRELNVSTKLMGGRDPKTGLLREVSLMDMITQAHDTWEQPGWPSRHLEFYDTEKIWRFLVDAGRCSDPREARKCDPALLRWLEKNRPRLKTQDSYSVLGDRVKRTTKNVGSSKNPVWVKDKEIPYTAWETIEGISVQN